MILLENLLLCQQTAILQTKIGWINQNIQLEKSQKYIWLSSKLWIAITNTHLIGKKF